MILTPIIFFLLGLSCFYLFYRIRLGKFETMASQIIHRAELDAEKIHHKTQISLKEQQFAQARDFEASWLSEKKKLSRDEERLEQKEDKLEQRLTLLEKKISDVEKKETQWNIKNDWLEKEQIKVELALKDYRKLLEGASNLSAEKAKELLFTHLQGEIKADSARFIKRESEERIQQADLEAAQVIATAIQRMATSTSSDVTTCTVSLPSEDMKGRIIGREGRNIRALEKATGATFIMDDTPQAIVISSYDPIRRNIAKLALTELINDGRIHPTSIENAVVKATETSLKQIQYHGEDAAFRIGVFNFHPEIITLLGKLKLRYSLGQNVLDHSLEVAHLMGIMANELGLDSCLAKRIGLLHDIGKAVSHEIQGSHAIIGHDLALKYGETPLVAVGIGCHHFEMSPTSIEAILCNAADAISAGRLGARSEPVEEYVKRLRKLEELALTFPGVEKAYALSAGRELRVIALPDQLNDEDLTLLAKNLTQRIQKELNYSGKIKVTLLREKRVVDYAM